MASNIERHNAPSGAAGGKMTTQPRILLVADETARWVSLANSLQALGFEMHMCTSADMASTLAGFAPSLVISTCPVSSSDLKRLPHLALGTYACQGSVTRLDVDAHPLQITSRIRAMTRLDIVERVAALRGQDALDAGQSLPTVDSACDGSAILFVGEPAPVFMHLQHALQEANIETIAAFSTFNAFDYLHDRSFDAVILNALNSTDLAFTVCSAMRRNTRLFHTPAVLLTCEGQAIDTEEAFARGATDLLNQATPKDQLRDTIAGLNTDRARRRKAKLELEACRTTDLLDQTTDLFAREFGEQHFSSLIKAHDARRQPLSLVGICADAPSSAGGTQIESALNQFASMLRHCVRTEDLAVRADGNQFYLALPNTPDTGANTVAARISAISECTAYESANPSQPFRLELSTQVLHVDGSKAADQWIKSALSSAPARGLATAI